MRIFASAVAFGSLIMTAFILWAAEADSLKTNLINASKQEVGSAELVDSPNGVLIKLQLSGFPQGTHAMHIHAVGKCEPPFKSAGGHFNPAGKKHGLLDKNGMHAGDLPNIHVPSSGNLQIEVLADGVSLNKGKNRLLDADGSALVIHEGVDDYKTDPAGNAGDRLACAVIEKSR